MNNFLNSASQTILSLAVSVLKLQPDRQERDLVALRLMTSISPWVITNFKQDSKNWLQVWSVSLLPAFLVIVIRFVPIQIAICIALLNIGALMLLLLSIQLMMWSAYYIASHSQRALNVYREWTKSDNYRTNTFYRQRLYRLTLTKATPQRNHSLDT